MNRRILIVEDAAFMRIMLTDILVKEGYEVVGEAEDGLEGLKLYKELYPDAVILNVIMPKMDGIATLKEILAHDSDANVVMLTATSTTATLVDSLKNGAKDFVAKPFHAETLIKSLNNSYMATAKYNVDYLDKLCTYSKEDDDTLSQMEVDNIIQTARNLNF